MDFFLKSKIFILIFLLLLIFINVLIYFSVTSFIFKNEEEKIYIYSSFVIQNLKKGIFKLKDGLNYEEIYNFIDENIGELNKYKWQILVLDKKGFLLYDSHRTFKLMKKDDNYFKELYLKEVLFGKDEINKVKIKGEKYFVYSALISELEWMIIFQIKEEIFLEKFYNLLLPQIIFSILVFILIVLFIIFFIKNILSPIEVLTFNLKKYGEGENIRQINITSRNREISAAVTAFNEMIKERNSLEEELLKIAEKERERIGRDLHDDLGQILTGINFQFMLLKEELKNNYNITTNLDELTNLISMVISKVKNISKMLFPAIEEDLLITIEELVKNFIQTYKIKIDFLYDKDISITNGFLVTNIYHILTESLNNSIKHGNASYIKIILKKGDKFVLEIIDNGKGFDPNAKSYGMGLKNIKYRARIIGGNVFINSELGKGTLLRVEF